MKQDVFFFFLNLKRKWMILCPYLKSVNKTAKKNVEIGYFAKDILWYISFIHIDSSSIKSCKRPQQEQCIYLYKFRILIM